MTRRPTYANLLFPASGGHGCLRGAPRFLVALNMGKVEGSLEGLDDSGTREKAANLLNVFGEVLALGVATH